MYDIVHRTQLFIASKMSGFVPKKEHLREALLFCIHLMKSAAESHHLLVESMLYRKQLVEIGLDGSKTTILT